MAKILITSGPTRQYLDPVRYLTNASSGRMGAALAEAAIAAGHHVQIISGPVHVSYPSMAEVIQVVTTDEMLDAACDLFSKGDCEGAIGAAAPCDYQPRFVATKKISKTGQPLELQLIETADVIATLGQRKRNNQWVVGFALESEDVRFRAITKLERKHCDLMVSNRPEAIDSDHNQVELLSPNGEVLASLSGTKESVSRSLIHEIDKRLVRQA